MDELTEISTLVNAKVTPPTFHSLQPLMPKVEQTGDAIEEAFKKERDKLQNEQVQLNKTMLQYVENSLEKINVFKDANEDEDEDEAYTNLFIKYYRKK